MLMAGSALAAAPAGFSINSFPGQMPAEVPGRVEPAGMLKSPLNPEKGLGAKIFGYTTVDYDGIMHYLDFFSSNPSKLYKLNEILIPNFSYDETAPRNIRALGGGWAGDKYYTYRVFYYSIGAPAVLDWISVDPKTGQANQEATLAQNGVSPAWWSFATSSAWNPNSPNDLYVLSQNTDGTITSVLHKVDKSNGRYTSTVKVFPKYYFSVAFDYDNQLYGLTWDYDADGNITGTIIDVLDADDNFNLISSTPIQVDGKAWKIYYENDITFDYTTGDLWWVAVRPKPNEEGNVDVRLIRVDPLTLATESIGTLGVNETVGGLYIDYDTAESRKAPARVKGADFLVDPAGEAKVTLTWTNPSTMWNRRNLTNLSSVEIYRDSYPGTPVGTVTATGKEGATMQWTDNGASNGIHKYYIVPVNASGKGVPYAINAFVGKDVPGPVQNLVSTTTDGRTINLQWTKPVTGDNEGWFDDSDLSYRIVRQPDNVVVTTTKNTSFHDTTIGEVDRYYYQIYASNAAGEGACAVSDAVIAGDGVKPPFSTLFETKVEADRFSQIDKNGDYKMFEYDFNSHLIRETMRLDLSDYDNDDVLVTPTLKVKKGMTYKLVYKVFFGTVEYEGVRKMATPFRLIGGTAPTAEAMTDIHFDDPDHVSYFPGDTEDYTVYFTAPVDGDYYVGLETLVKQEKSAWLYIEGFSIDEAPDNDLEAVSVDAHLYLSTVGNNRFDVTIYNNGSNDQSKYTVKVAVLDKDGNPKPFAETSDVPAIKSHESAKVTLNAKMPGMGEQPLVAVIDLEGDGNVRNNVTAPLIVQCDETDPLNFTFNMPEKQSTITNVPFQHFNACTASQTIYTPEMTLLDAIDFEDTPKITRIAWEGTAKMNLRDFNDTKLTIYMSQTDRKGYSLDAPAFLPVNSEPLFEDFVTLRSGRNYVVADFEEGFEFDPTEALVVTVLKEDNNHADWLYDWRTFDADWEAQYLHSVSCTGATPIDINAPSGRIICFADAPVLHLAVTGMNSGIGQIVISKNHAAYYSRSTSSVQTSDIAIAAVEVYNANGQLIERVKGDGSTSVRIGSDKGVALIRIIGVDGTVLSFKTII